MQFSILMLMFSLKIGKDDSYRYFINSIMFFVISLFSGAVFYALGGKVGYFSIQELIIPLFVYQIVLFILNQILLYWSKIMLKKKAKLFAKDMIWDFCTLVMILPLVLHYIIYLKRLAMLHFF